MISPAEIERLYRAFAPYPRRASIDACPHCVGEERRETLARVPLRALSCDQLGPFAFRAMTTWGEALDFKHFLPRILELASTPEGTEWPGFDLEVLAGKLERAGWKSWPPEERAAVIRWFESAAEWARSGGPNGGSWTQEGAFLALSRLGATGS